MWQRDISAIAIVIIGFLLIYLIFKRDPKLKPLTQEEKEERIRVARLEYLQTHVTPFDYDDRAMEKTWVTARKFNPNLYETVTMITRTGERKLKLKKKTQLNLIQKTNEVRSIQL